MPENAQPITEVHVSQDAPSLLGAVSSRFGEPALTIRAIDEAVPMLGAVMSYGAVVAPLQAAWLETQARAPQRLFSRFGSRRHGAEERRRRRAASRSTAGIAERFDLAVVAEGGVFADRRRRAISSPAPRAPALRHDYGQTAWVGIASFAGGDPCRHAAASPTSASRATARPRCCR